MSRSDATARSNRSGGRVRGTRLSGAGAVAVVLAFGAFGGLAGLAAGVAVAVGSLVLPATYAFAFGHVALLFALPSPTLRQIAAVELGLAAVLVSPMAGTDGGRRLIAATALCFVGLAAVVAPASLAVDPLWTVAAALVALVAALSYGVHRYERLRLGLLEGEEP